MPLIFSKQLNVTKLLIDHPEIFLLRNREGVWNFSSLGNQSAQAAKPAEKTSSTPANINVAKLDLTDGTITVGSMENKRKPISYDKVNITIRDFSFTSAFPVVRFRSSSRRRQFEDRWHRRPDQFDGYRAYACSGQGEPQQT